MSEIVQTSLKTSVKGLTLVFFGMVSSVLLWFASKLIIVRNTTKEELGIYSLVIAIASICSLSASLGLQEGISRHVSVLRGEGKEDSAVKASGDTAVVGMLSGLLFFVVLFSLSHIIAGKLFFKPALETPLKVLSLVVPFSVVSSIMSGALRGHNIVKPRVFADVGQPLFFVIFLGISILLGLSFIGIIYAYVLSTAIIFAGTAWFFARKIRLDLTFHLDWRGIADLLRFSIPLLATSVLVIVLTWTDTLMLGRYTSADQVGIYNVSSSLARLLTFPATALGFVFMPLAGEMYAKGQTGDLKRTYQVLTKWIFSATLPIFFVLFFFPEMTISFLFGTRFVDASVPLRILSFGFLFNSLMGVNGMLLTVLGRSREIMNVSAIGTVLNVILNYFLIKRAGFGIVGAAVATLVSYVTLNVILSIILYRKSTIHPVTKEYAYPVMGSLLVGLIIYIIAKNLPLHFWMLPFYLIAFVSGYGAVLFITRSVEREDLYIFQTILEKVGVRPESAKRFMKRFSRNILL